MAGTLWPFGDDLRATGNLRSSLWRLRQAGIDVIHTDKFSLGLAEGVRVDVELLASRVHARVPRALPVVDQAQLARQMVKVGTYLATPEGFDVRDQAVTVQQADGVSDAKKRASEDRGFAGEDFVPGATHSRRWRTVASRRPRSRPSASTSKATTSQWRSLRVRR